MEYLLEIDFTPYHLWQTEILLQSFIKNKCQDELVININDKTNNINISNFVVNLKSHKRKTLFKNNFGEKKGFKKINKFFNVIDGLNNQTIKQPFCFLEPDMVLFKRLSIVEKNYPQFLFSADPSFTLDYCESKVGTFCEWFDLDRKNIEKNWLPIGDLQVFDKIPIFFFRKVIENNDLLCVKQLLNGKEIWEETAKVALAITVLQNLGKIGCIVDYNFLLPPESFTDSFFITYKNGIKPSFHKSMFLYAPPGYISFDDPIKVMSKLEATPANRYFSELARSCLAKR